MVKSRRQAGFSLTETLLAVGTLAIGLTFISGTFLTGVFFSTTSTERTVAAVAAEEALAKIRIYGLDPNGNSLTTSGFVLYRPSLSMPVEEYLYPSSRLEAQRQYSWSAICRRLNVGSPLVQCTVFVSRQTPSATYWVRKSGSGWPQLDTSNLPQPLRVNVVQAATPTNADVVTLQDAVANDGIDELAFVNDGSVLVDDATGQVYRVLERFGTPANNIRLDRAWTGGTISSSGGGWVWVIPPATSGGRYPAVSVYQDVIRFPGN